MRVTTRKPVQSGLNKNIRNTFRRENIIKIKQPLI